MDNKDAEFVDVKELYKRFDEVVGKLAERIKVIAEPLNEILEKCLEETEEIETQEEMTTQEALEILDTIPTIGSQVEALEIAIKALERSVEEEKIIKPTITGYNNAIGCECGMCECGNMVRSYMKYCSECGKRLDWEDGGEDE